MSLDEMYSPVLDTVDNCKVAKIFVEIATSFG